MVYYVEDDKLHAYSQASDKQNQMTVKRECNLSIESMTTERIGRSEVPLAIDHKYHISRGSWTGQKPGERRKLFLHFKISVFEAELLLLW